MKRISLVVVICLIISFTGCAKLMSTEYESVEVNVVDEYYRASYTKVEYNVPLKMPMAKTVPAIYYITVEYNGVEYTVGGSDTYNKYKDMVGQTAIGTLEIRTYDDGTVKYDITELD